MNVFTKLLMQNILQNPNVLLLPRASCFR